MNEASLMGLPRELRDQILEYLLPNNQIIDVRREPHKVRDQPCRHYFHDQRAPLRHEHEACDPTILQTCHQLNAEGSWIMYNRTFHLRIEGGGERGRGKYLDEGIHFVNSMWPGVFERFRFHFARAKEIQLDIVAELDSDMPIFLLNLDTVCKRLDRELSLRNLRVNFLDVVPPFTIGDVLHWGEPEKEGFHGREHIEVVLQHLALLGNVGQAKVILPESLRDDLELQSLVRDCENAMMTARPVRDREVSRRHLREYTRPKPPRTLLDKAGFNASFYREQEKLVLTPASIKNRRLRSKATRSNLIFSRFMSRCREYTGWPEPRRTLLNQAGFGASFYQEQYEEQ